MTKIKNLTPHTITITEGPHAGVYESEGIARVDQLPLGDLIDLPDPEKDTLLVVSVITAERAAGRSDLRVPGEQIRGEGGRVIGCRGLSKPEGVSPALALLAMHPPGPVAVIFGSTVSGGADHNSDIDVASFGLGRAELRALLKEAYPKRHHPIIDDHPELVDIVDGRVVVTLPTPKGTGTPRHVVLRGGPIVQSKEVDTIPALIRRMNNDGSAGWDRATDRFREDFHGGDILVLSEPGSPESDLASGAYVGNGVGALRRALKRSSKSAINEAIPGLGDLLVAVADGVSSACLRDLLRGTSAGQGRGCAVRITKSDSGEWVAGTAHGDLPMLPLGQAALWLSTGVYPAAETDPCGA